jgi:hypothetical protein
VSSANGRLGIEGLNREGAKDAKGFLSFILIGWTIRIKAYAFWA